MVLVLTRTQDFQLRYCLELRAVRAAGSSLKSRDLATIVERVNKSYFEFAVFQFIPCSRAEKFKSSKVSTSYLMHETGHENLPDAELEAIVWH